MRKETEINEMDGKLHEEYENRLQQALEELRDVYDKQMQQSREDFAKLYDDRVSRLDVYNGTRGGRKLGRWPKSGLGQVFNSKLGSFFPGAQSKHVMDKATLSFCINSYDGVKPVVYANILVLLAKSTYLS